MLRVFWYSAEVCGDEFVAVGGGLQRHPHDGHLRAAVGIECDQCRVGAGSDEFAGGVVEFHALFYRLRARFHSLSRPRGRAASTWPAGRPTYWPVDPSERTTRWQGITTGSGLWAQAVPTARTARGLPTAAATVA